MRIATPAEKLTAVAVGDRITVNSFGHDYRATVVEVKGNRARLAWVNKSGNRYDNWLTIPGRTEKDRNPTAAATRKLRVQATALEKNAQGWMTRDLDRATATLAQFEALRGATPTRQEKTPHGTVLYYVGETMVWGGYTPEAARRYGYTGTDRAELPFDQALERAITQAQGQLETARTRISESLAKAAALRAQADEIQRGSK